MTHWAVASAIGLALLALGATWAIVARNRSATDSAVSERSIAVLPFENLSRDTSMAGVVAGLHAEIVTQLTKLGELNVISRSSVLEYRNSAKSQRTIASELGVKSLLTGSVQRSGDQLHVLVALADASLGKQLWAESYDRPYTAVGFIEIQGDIARQVASALRVKLSDQQQQAIARAPTTNLAALDAYYRGLAQWQDRLTLGDDTLAVQQLEQAVALDSSFVAAWSLLAQARAWLVRRSYVHDTVPAWEAVRQTQTLAPGSLEAALSAGYYRYYARGDFAGALKELSTADRLMPNSSEILQAMALLERRLGRWDEAIALMDRGIQRDPRNARLRLSRGESLLYMRRFEEAERELDRALAVQPRLSAAIGRKFHLLQQMGDTARARDFLHTSAPFLPRRAQLDAAGDVAILARDYPSALANYGKRPDGFFGGWHRNLDMALVAAASGDSSLARRHADSVLRAGRAELADRQTRGALDPFQLRTLVEAQMAVALAIRGERVAAVRLAEACERRYGLAQDAFDGFNAVWTLARTYMLVGRRGDAVAALKRLLAIPADVTVQSLRLDPTWDGLRNDPAFQHLIATTE